MKKIRNVFYVLCVFFVCSCNSKQNPSIEHALGISEKKVQSKEATFCEILDSLAKRTSSIPYDTYRGTPYLKKELDKIDKNKVVYHFYEDYPEYDEEGFYNGGMVTLRYVILRKKPDSLLSITIKSNSSIKDVDISKINKLQEDIFLISTLEYFNGEDPFYEDKIDFSLSFEGDILDFSPVLIGVYWANIKDYYDENKCK